MTQATSELARQFAFNGRTLTLLADGMEAADWACRPGESGGNTPHWILGHLSVSRRYLARKLGAEIPEDGWESHFGMNAEVGDTAGYPAPDALLEDFDAAGKTIARLLAELDAEAAAVEWGSKFPDGGRTIVEGARFLHFHEAYHLGQLGLLRRICGKPGIV